MGGAGVVIGVGPAPVTKKISEQSSCTHAGPEAVACAGSSSASWVLLSLSVVTVESVAWVSTRIARVGTGIA